MMFSYVGKAGFVYSLLHRSISPNKYHCRFLFSNLKYFQKMSETDKEELKKRLTPIQYLVTQEKGTERPFTGKFNKTTEAGTYCCVVCDEPLFSSDTKFDAGCGWPAFNEVLEQKKVKLTPDTSNVGANLLLLISKPGMIRTEVTCAKCGAHLGHVFNDGPLPSKKRFCINSASLEFYPVGGNTNNNNNNSSTSTVTAESSSSS